MAARNLFTFDEVTLCTYAALYDVNDYGGENTITQITGRSIGSIRMKIQNIAAMLDDKGISRFNSVSPLTGTPPGQPARETHWQDLQSLLILSREDFRRKCFEILAKK